MSSSSRHACLTLPAVACRGARTAVPRCSRPPSSTGRATSRGPGTPSARVGAGRGSRRCGIDVMSVPRRRTVPLSIGTRRRSARPVVDLPDPDSPTSPSVSPVRTARSTPFTARTLAFGTSSPPRDLNETHRDCASRMGSAGVIRCPPTRSRGCAGSGSSVRRTTARAPARARPCRRLRHRGSAGGNGIRSAASTALAPDQEW